MISYLSQLTLCWCVFYAAYYFFLRQETHFRYNRLYLLLALGLGIVLPLADWSLLIVHQPESLGHLYIAPLNNQMSEWDFTVQTTPQGINWRQVFWMVYLLGFLAAVIQLIRGWLMILSIRRKSEFTEYNGYPLVLTAQSHMPFSFLNSVYCSRDFYTDSPHIEKILVHETFHIKARHSLDVIALEVLKVVFWFHPLVYFYKRELQQIHEYQADFAAYQLSSRKAYGKLLLSQAESGIPVALANHFFNSQLKNRFKMMTKKPSTRQSLLKYLFIIPMVAMAVLIFSFTGHGQSVLDKQGVSRDTIIAPQEALISSPASSDRSMTPEQNEIFRVVEEMPRFPGCEEITGDVQARKSCADRKMLEFLYTNIRYPEEARNNGVEGNVVLSFIVETDGTLADPKVIRDPGSGLGEESVRVVEMMKELPEKWTPGKQRGKNVRVQFILPVKFQIVEPRKDTTKVVVAKDGLQIRSASDNRKDAQHKGAASEALLVIDGEVMGRVNSSEMLRSIDPQNIASVSVLKGESAEEKYGRKGANGVVEISTKWKDGTELPRLEMTNVRIYPVPADNSLNIEAGAPGVGDYQLDIRDLKGSVVRHLSVTVSDGILNSRVNLSGLTAGPYFLMISRNGKVFSKSFVKQ